MKSAAIRLDSFSTQLTASDSSRALANDLDAAFHRGYEQGLNEGRESSLDALTAALTDVQRHVSTSNEGMATARREVIAGQPVARQVVNLLLRGVEDRIAPIVARLHDRVLEVRAEPEVCTVLDHALILLHPARGSLHLGWLPVSGGRSFQPSV